MDKNENFEIWKPGISNKEITEIQSKIDQQKEKAFDDKNIPERLVRSINDEILGTETLKEFDEMNNPIGPIEGKLDMFESAKEETHDQGLDKLSNIKSETEGVNNAISEIDNGNNIYEKTLDEAKEDDMDTFSQIASHRQKLDDLDKQKKNTEEDLSEIDQRINEERNLVKKINAKVNESKDKFHLN